MRREAQEEVHAEIARLEKSWQCGRLSAFAHQCSKVLMQFLPKTWQIAYRHNITEANLLKHKQSSQTDAKEENTDEKTATKQAKLKKRSARHDRRDAIGEKRIQQAKFEWLKECRSIMHKGKNADKDGFKVSLKSRVDNKEQVSFANTANNKERKEWLVEFVKHGPLDDGARACDTLDACTVAFFIQAVRLSRADSGGELAFSPIWQALDEATRTRLTGDSSSPSWATGAATKPPAKASKGKTVNAEMMSRADPVPPATQTEIQELSFWLADQFVSQAFEVYYYYRKKEMASCWSKKESKKDSRREWFFQQQEKLRTMDANLNVIFKSENFQSCNVHNLFQVSCGATNNTCLPPTINPTPISPFTAHTHTPHIDPPFTSLALYLIRQRGW